MIAENMSEFAVLKSLKAHFAGIEQKRFKERYRMLNYYEGLESELQVDISKHFDSDSLQQVPAFLENVTAKLVNSRAIVYKQAPQRHTDDKYLEGVKSLDSMMLQVERMTYLLGSMAMLSKWNEEEQKVEYDVLTEFYPVWVPHISEPVGVCYPLYSQGQTRSSEMTYVYWSPEQHFKITQGGDIISVEENDDRVNPYGLVPVSYSHRHPFTTDWWREGASDVVSLNTTLNILLTEMSFSMRLQALGQPVISGIDSAQKLKMGVDRPILLPEGATFQFAAPGTNLVQYIDAVRFLVDSVAYNNNLKTKWSQGRDAVSGEALKMLEVDLTESVMGDAEHIWRPFEKARFHVDRRILEVHGVKVSEDYSVDFSEPRFPLSAAEERAQFEHELKHGLSSKKDWFRKNNPDAENLDEIIGQVQAERTEEKEQEQTEQPEQPAQPVFEGLRRLGGPTQ